MTLLTAMASTGHTAQKEKPLDDLLLTKPRSLTLSGRGSIKGSEQKYINGPKNVFPTPDICPPHPSDLSVPGQNTSITIPGAAVYQGCAGTAEDVMPHKGKYTFTSNKLI
ncbi:hypothetical protein CEXT_240171 [Caerostris extrusa]|uniref:Uncharacterized protein n=1 Tax=Caerostris extrusa TaxID=172846 RepID=A0AAV4PUB3_CAEEX|nr:hypothetical protein CEXT_240171 [Caerostris extrusa]